MSVTVAMFLVEPMQDDMIARGMYTYRCARALALAVAVCAWPVGIVEAFPIRPAPLHVVTFDAKLIVVADVEDVSLGDGSGLPARARAPAEEPNAAIDDLMTSAVAVLRIREVLKGEAPGAVIRVPFPAALVCPAPPDYEKGERVVAFLRPSARDPATWETCHLSYGRRPVPDAETNRVLKERIAELLDIQALDGQARRERIIEFWVRCVDESSTCWDGAHSLSQALHGWGGLERADFRATADDLSRSQRSRLVRALLSADRNAPGRYALIAVVRIFYDTIQVTALIAELRGLKLDDVAVARAAQDKMLQIADAVGWPEGREIAQRVFNEGEAETVSKERRNERIGLVYEFRTAATKRDRACSKALRPPS